MQSSIRYSAFFIVGYKENHRQCRWFQKALAMPNPAAAESLPCVRGGFTALSRDGGVVLVVTIPSHRCAVTAPFTQGGLSSHLTASAVVGHHTQAKENSMSP